MTTSDRELTQLLKEWGEGRPGALERLTPLVYEQLRRLARSHTRRERRTDTLQTTALVHEAYLRITQGAKVSWQDRRHFFAVAAQTMRRILVDAARARTAVKRGGGAVVSIEPDEWDGLPDMTSERARNVCALDDALQSLAKLDPRRAQVVELRFFGGLTVEETADVLDVSRLTVIRDWKVARAYLMREIEGRSQ